jgi:hypothetical protein
MDDKNVHQDKKKEDLYKAYSDKKWVGGALELFLRKFRLVSFLVSLAFL